MAETTTAKPKVKFGSRLIEHPLLRKYFPLVSEDLAAVYTRDLYKWLLLAPIIGVTTGLAVTAIAIIILKKLWPPVLHLFLRRPWTILPVMTAAFAVTGLIMQFLTPDPDQHSTEEIIRSYHEHQGDIDVRSFFPKILAAITTVGFGGSAALEGPSIYGGGAIGLWLWTKLRRVGLEPSDRRIMLISGAAAGMAAVFRAPMTGLVFALEMPYKDDLAHEALLPSLIASVVSYVTLAFFLGATPLFNFASRTSFTGRDLLWSALLGVLIGLVAMAFTITFRRARVFMVHWAIPHWLKLTLGGFLTGVCGLGFLSLFHGSLLPLGPNYEAVGEILGQHHSSLELVVFGVLKLAATLCTLASGGVSAMFVPLFLTGGSFGTAFAQSIVHSSSVELYAAVGMASFIAAGYKTPLAAVVFVAEATGGHAFIIPALIGAAVAYAISGEASASGDQRLHEGIRIQELGNISVSQIMQPHVMSVSASATLREFAESLGAHARHTAFPVLAGENVVGWIAVSSLSRVAPEAWATTRVEDLAEREVEKISLNLDVMEALRLLLSERHPPLLLVTSPKGKLEGVLTKTDILTALRLRSDGYLGIRQEGRQSRTCGAIRINGAITLAATVPRKRENATSENDLRHLILYYGCAGAVMPYQTLYITETEEIATVTFNRSERRNALTPQMIEELIAILDDLSHRNCGVLVLTGRGPAFCAGLDLEHLQSLVSKTLPEHNVDAERMAHLLRRLYDLPLPTIAAVNGHAIAGGMGLATVCDFTLAVPEAKFGYTEARVGFIPAIVSSFLTLQVGEKQARDLLLTARLITAEEALRMGLVNEVVRDSGLMERALRLAHQLLKNSPESMRATKQLLSAHVKDRLDRQLQAAVEINANARSTEDFREGVSAFLERRTPIWPSRKRCKTPVHT